MNKPSTGSGHTAAMLRYESEKKSPGLAAVINFFFPGLGDAYAGRPIAGVSAFVVVLILGLLTFGVVYVLAAIVGIFTGIQTSQEYNRKIAQELSGEKHSSEFKYNSSSSSRLSSSKKIEDMSDDEIRALYKRRFWYNVVAVVGVALLLALALLGYLGSSLSQ